METQNSELQHVRLEIDARLISSFLKLIEQGFKLKVKTGLTIRELLCGQFGVSGEYFDNRIQTIFLDGKAVDNVDAAGIEDNSRLALSAAMPGLVGATFRKGGRYAPLRGTISYSKEKKSIVRGEGKNRTFYNHEMVSTKVAANLADRLKFSKAEKEKLVTLVRWHQFTCDERQTDSAIRRFIRNVGKENLQDMLDLRVGDRLGGGARETSWRLEEFKKR